MTDETDSVNAEESLVERYRRLVSKYRKLIHVEDAEIQLIDKEASRHLESYFDNKRYYIVTVFAAITVFTGSVLVYWQYFYALQLADALNSQAEIHQFGISHVGLFRVIMISMAAPFFYSILPLLLSAMPSRFTIRETDDPFHHVRWRSGSYLVFAITLNYFAGWIFIVSLAATGWVETSVMRWMSIVWVMLTAPIFFFGPGALVLILFALLIYRGDSSRYNRMSNPAVIVRRLIILIDGIPDRAAPSTAFETVKKEMLSQINSIANAIGGMGRLEKLRGAEGEHCQRTFENASSAFRSLSTLLLMPRSGGFMMLRHYSIRFLNVFLSGHYESLPQSFALLAPMQPKNAKRSVVHVARSLGALMLFLIVPVLAWLALQYFHGFEVDPLAKTFLTIVYACWCVVGTVSLADEFAPEAKETILATLKVLLPKSG